jgi:Sec-independent protein translocase protein TatA
MFANSGPGHWLVLGVVMVLMSALSKLPEAARYGGKSLRILKSELHELHTDDRWSRNRSPRPSGPGGALTAPASRASTKPTPTPNGHGRPTRTSVSTRRTPDCATRCLRCGAFEITGPVVEPGV